MTLLTVCQSAAHVIGIEVPDVVATSTDRTYVELLAVANDMAETISKAHEWQLLNTVETVTGDASTEDFSLPTDYDRMIKDTDVWSSSLETPLTPVPDRNTWLGLDIRSYDFVVNAWIVYGGQFHIKPAMGTGVTAKYWYQSNLIIAPSAGSNKALFTSDDDTFRLNERLLRLGIIWKWKANKGQPYAEPMADYEEAKEKLISDDKGSRTIRIGRARLARGMKTAYPTTISA